MCVLWRSSKRERMKKRKKNIISTTRYAYVYVVCWIFSVASLHVSNTYKIMSIISYYEHHMFGFIHIIMNVDVWNEVSVPNAVRWKGNGEHGSTACVNEHTHTHAHAKHGICQTAIVCRVRDGASSAEGHPTIARSIVIYLIIWCYLAYSFAIAWLLLGDKRLLVCWWPWQGERSRHVYHALRRVAKWYERWD